MNSYYTCEGSVRGCCGHKHRTFSAAEKCQHSDSVGCRRQGGYSDRRIYMHDADGRRPCDESGRPLMTMADLLVEDCAK